MIDCELSDIEFCDADDSWTAKMGQWWEDGIRNNFHLTDGFALIAHCTGELVGYISIVWRDLPTPLTNTREAFIDFIEVCEEYRRKGIARHLIDLSEQRARREHVCQIRAWSSEDKTEAIPMWKALGYSLCPADPRDEGARGYYVAKRLDRERNEDETYFT